MSENNSPSEESNQEQSSVPDEKTEPNAGYEGGEQSSEPDEKTEPNAGYEGGRIEAPSPAVVINADPNGDYFGKSADGVLDTAMREKDSLAATETLAPPPADHGWLEQFKAFGGEAFAELEKVAAQGLLELESDMLVQLAAKLIRIAHTHDANALSKLLDSVDDLN